MGTLSEKLMYQMGDEELDNNNMVIHKDDVKEFLKTLKQNLNERRMESNNPPFRRGLRWVEFEINKLAGEDLAK